MAESSQGKRFEALDKEFNLAITSISKSDPKDILNTGFNTVQQITAALKKLVEQIKGILNVKETVTDAAKSKAAEAAAGLDKIKRSFGDTTSQIKDLMDSVRSIKGTSRSTFDPSKLTQTNLDRYIDSVFPGDSISQNLFKEIGGGTRDQAISNITSGVPFKPTVSIPDPGGVLPPQTYRGDTNADYYQVANLLDSTTNRSYPQTVIDNGAILRQAVIVGNLAYNANLPNVMRALRNIPNMQSDVLARATAIILEEQAGRGNIAAVVDIAQYVTEDNFPIQQAPSAIKDIASTFKPPRKTIEEQLPVLGQTLFETFSTIDPKWRVSLTDGIPSTRNIVHVSKPMADTIKSRIMNNIFHPVSGLETLYTSDDDILSVAILAVSPQTNVHLGLLSEDVTCMPYRCDC